MNNTKVVFCTDGIFPHAVGGMQRHSKLLIEELARQDAIELVVIHPHVGEKVFDDAVNEIVVEGLEGKSNYLIELYQYSKRVYEVVERLPNHVIYSQGLSIWYNANKLSKRLIINPHGLESFQALSTTDKLKGIPFRLIFKYVFNRASHVVSLGGKLTTILKKTITNSHTQIATLPNATNLPVHASNPDFSTKKINCLFVGRFASNKGISHLLEAITTLNAQGKTESFEFFLAGKGPLYEELKASHTLPNTHFLGFVSDEQLENLYKESHIFILPTLFEGMPTVVFEAMARRLPIIVTDVGATKEQVDDSNGYIIEKESSKAIVEALQNFKNLPVHAKQSMGENSYKTLKNKFTWPIVAQRHISLFNDIQHKIQD